MVTEDDTRKITGGEGKKIGTIAADTPAEAYACRLSFACPDVPDIFSSAVA